MVRTVLAAIAICSIAGCAKPPAPALDLKGVTPGMSEAEVKQKIPGLMCTSLAAEPGKRECSWLSEHSKPIAALRTVADFPARSWVFAFFDDKLGQVTVEVGAAFGELLTPMTAKYGKPMERQAVIAGAQVVEWVGSNGSLKLVAGAGRTFVNLEAPWNAERQAKANKERKKDL